MKDVREKKREDTQRAMMSDSAYVKMVLTHYKQHGRHDLPWRKAITPYNVLVSEVMLQQTQVARVIPKFLGWCKKYPTTQALREASLRDVLILWQGLGYQRRAKALLRIAQECTELPKSFDELLKLPGVGIYTASAVCAFAYDSFAYPVLETNIRTVLIEFFHRDEEGVLDSVLYEDLRRLEQSVRVKRVGARDWYYALMDYGAYLKTQGVSHNTKSKHHAKQKPYKGSTRELRAKVLFAVTHGERLPSDERTATIVDLLEKEGYIVKRGKKFLIA